MLRRREGPAPTTVPVEGRGCEAVVRIVPNAALWARHAAAGMASLVGDLLEVCDAPRPRLVLDFRQRHAPASRRARRLGRPPVGVPELRLELGGALDAADAEPYLEAAAAWLARGPRATGGPSTAPRLAFLRLYGPDGALLADLVVADRADPVAAA